MWYKWLLDENKLRAASALWIQIKGLHPARLWGLTQEAYHLHPVLSCICLKNNWTGNALFLDPGAEYWLTFTPWIFIKLVYGIFQYERKLQNNWMSCPKFWEYLNRISVYDLLDLLTITIQVELFFPSMLGKKKMELTNGGDSASYVTVTR